MLKTLMGEYPVTKQFHTHTDKFAFADAKKNPASAFKRTVRELEFDVSEMAIMTHLIARAHGKPYRLLPFVVLARFQHPFLVFNSNKNPSLAPEDLHGKRVGLRSYWGAPAAWGAPGANPSPSRSEPASSSRGVVRCSTWEPPPSRSFPPPPSGGHLEGD